MVGGIAGGVLIAGAAIGWFATRGPEEVSEREFATSVCNLQKSFHRELERLADDDEDLIADLAADDVSGRRDAESAKRLVTAQAVLMRDYATGIRELADQNVVSSRDGGDLRDELLEAYGEALVELEADVDELLAVDLDDRSAGSDIADIWEDVGKPLYDIELSSSTEDLWMELDSEIRDRNDRCWLSLAPGEMNGE